MKKSLFVLLVSITAGFGAAVGTIVGGGLLGRAGFVAGGILFGVMGVSSSVRAACKLHLCNSTSERRAFVGGTVGFLLAVPLAILGSRLFHTPIIPITAAFLAGAGAVIGAERRPTRRPQH